MRKIFTTLVFLLPGIGAFAQQDPQFSQYMFNKLFMNPAYAGMRQAYCFSLIARDQWAGFNGAPKSGVFSADVALQPWCGIGLNIMYDKLGFENNMRYVFDYSHHINDVYDGTLGFGIELGAFSKRVGPTGSDQWLATTNWQTDVVIPPLLKKTVLDFGAGVWYQRKGAYIGISTSHLNAKLVDDGMSVTPPHYLRFQMAHHYFITGGYTFNPSADWKFKPSFLVKSDATITTFDVDVTALYEDRFWFGVSYRYKDAIVPMVGFQLLDAGFKNDETRDAGLKVGFAYDATISKLNNYSHGSFELFFNYCIPIKWVMSEHGDPRIFDKP